MTKRTHSKAAVLAAAGVALVMGLVSITASGKPAPGTRLCTWGGTPDNPTGVVTKAPSAPLWSSPDEGAGMDRAESGGHSTGDHRERRPPRLRGDVIDRPRDRSIMPVRRVTQPGLTWRLRRPT